MKYEKKVILETFKPFLWSYDLEQIDLEINKKRIITTVLNLGTKTATDLLFAVYSRQDIAAAVAEPLPGEWNKKSLNYWSIIFDVKPKKNVLRNIG
jgi:hypothetical protein